VAWSQIYRSTIAGTRELLRLGSGSTITVLCRSYGLPGHKFSERPVFPEDPVTNLALEVNVQMADISHKVAA
jgi:hypothetical protein